MQISPLATGGPTLTRPRDLTENIQLRWTRISPFNNRPRLQNPPNNNSIWLANERDVLSSLFTSPLLFPLYRKWFETASLHDTGSTGLERLWEIRLKPVNRCGSSAFHSNTDPWLPVRIVKILWEHVGREKLSLATVDDWSRDESFLRWIKLISIRNIMLVAGMCRLFPGEWRIS